MRPSPNDRIVVHDSQETLWTLAAENMLHSSDLSPSLHVKVQPFPKENACKENRLPDLPYRRQCRPHFTHVINQEQTYRPPLRSIVSQNPPESDIQVRLLREELRREEASHQQTRKLCDAYERVLTQFCKLHAITAVHNK